MIKAGKESSRNTEIDFLGGLIMLQIIFYHVSLTYTTVSWVTEGYKFIEYLLPNLAWFFYKGGMFYKNKPIKSVLQQGFSKLMLPYVSFAVIGIISAFIIQHDNVASEGLMTYCMTNLKELMLFGAIGIDGPIWHLLVFFGTKPYIPISE